MSAIGAKYLMKVGSQAPSEQSFVIDKCAAKIFIKLLLNPDPAQRPTAQEAFNNHVSYCLVNLRNMVSHDMVISSG